MMAAVPSTMRVVEISGPGGPEVLQQSVRPVPIPNAGEVLIQVSYAGVNRPDLMQRRGLYPPPPGASDIPGLEVSGTVAAFGPGVDSLSIGERVCALVTGGGYADYCVAPAHLCLPLPVRFSMAEAASLPEALFTVWTNVFDRGGLRPGERFLMHGGTSGIGVAAIQLARCHGAEVYATGGTAEKCRVIRQLGGQPINYRDEDFVDRIRELTAGAGVDVILDIIGGSYLQRNLTCLAQDGRLLQIALQEGVRSEINLLPIMLKRLTLTGSTLRARPIFEKERIAVSLRDTVWPWLDAGRVRPLIFREFALEKARESHSIMESGKHLGKILLKVTET
jgi:putative PIG3 family NAD(P)H quinone oxidoreductase